MTQATRKCRLENEVVDTAARLASKFTTGAVSAKDDNNSIDNDYHSRAGSLEAKKDKNPLGEEVVNNPLSSPNGFSSYASAVAVNDKALSVKRLVGGHGGLLHHPPWNTTQPPMR